MQKGSVIRRRAANRKHSSEGGLSITREVSRVAECDLIQ
jgi:hypothetical protein